MKSRLALHRQSNMAKRATILVVLPVLVLASACASQQSILETPPVKTALYAVARSNIQDCTYSDMRASANYAAWALDSTYQPRTKTGRILGSFTSLVGGVGVGVAWDLQFADIDGASTRVELRAIRNIWGGATYPDDLWLIVERCANTN